MRPLRKRVLFKVLDHMKKKRGGGGGGGGGGGTTAAAVAAAGKVAAAVAAVATTAAAVAAVAAVAAAVVAAAAVDGAGGGGATANRQDRPDQQDFDYPENGEPLPLGSRLGRARNAPQRLRLPPQSRRPTSPASGPIPSCPAR